MALRLGLWLNTTTIYTLQSIQDALEQTAQKTVGTYDVWSLGESIYQHILTVQTISICPLYGIVTGMPSRKASPGWLLAELWSHLPQGQVEIEVSCSWGCTERQYAALLWHHLELFILPEMAHIRLSIEAVTAQTPRSLQWDCKLKIYEHLKGS